MKKQLRFFALMLALAAIALPTVSCCTCDPESDHEATTSHELPAVEMPAGTVASLG